MSGAFQHGDDGLRVDTQSFNATVDVRALQESQEDLREIVIKQGAVIAEHQGNLKGVFPAVSAVQSSLGAWLTVVSIVTGLIVAVLVFNTNRTMAVGDRVGALEVRVGGVETGLRGVNDRLGLLPQQVAQELERARPATARGRR